MGRPEYPRTDKRMARREAVAFKLLVLLSLLFAAPAVMAAHTAVAAPPAGGGLRNPDMAVVAGALDCGDYADLHECAEQGRPRVKNPLEL